METPQFFWIKGFTTSFICICFTGQDRWESTVPGTSRGDRRNAPRQAWQRTKVIHGDNANTVLYPEGDNLSPKRVGWYREGSGFTPSRRIKKICDSWHSSLLFHSLSILFPSNHPPPLIPAVFATHKYFNDVLSSSFLFGLVSGQPFSRAGQRTPVLYVCDYLWNTGQDSCRTK